MVGIIHKVMYIPKLSLQNRTLILTEILTEKTSTFDRICTFWPKFWPITVGRKNVRRNFIVTEILAESQSKLWFDRNFDRQFRSKLGVWPNFDRLCGQKIADIIPWAGMRREKFWLKWVKIILWPVSVKISVKICNLTALQNINHQRKLKFELSTSNFWVQF